MPKRTLTGLSCSNMGLPPPSEWNVPPMHRMPLNKFISFWEAIAMLFRKTLQKESGRYLAAMAFLLITWYLAVTLFPIPKYLMPTPVAVGKVFISEYANLLM